MLWKKSNRPAGLPEEGRRSNLDKTPIARPVGFTRPPTIQQQIQAALRAHFEQVRSDAAETFEEADDFDVDDDPELRSPYEVDEVAAEQPRWKEKEQRKRAIEQAEEHLLKTVPKPAGQADPPSAGGKGSEKDEKS